MQSSSFRSFTGAMLLALTALTACGEDKKSGSPFVPQPCIGSACAGANDVCHTALGIVGLCAPRCTADAFCAALASNLVCHTEAGSQCAAPCTTNSECSRVGAAGVCNTATNRCVSGGGDLDFDQPDNPNDNPVDNPSDNPVDNPTDNPTDGPTDNPGDNPTDNPTDNPGDNPADLDRDTIDPDRDTADPDVTDNNNGYPDGAFTACSGSCGPGLACITFRDQQNQSWSVCMPTCGTPSICDFATPGSNDGLCLPAFQDGSGACLSGSGQNPATCTGAGSQCQNGQVTGQCIQVDQQGTLNCIPVGCTVQRAGCRGTDVCLPVQGGGTGICRDPSQPPPRPSGGDTDTGGSYPPGKGQACGQNQPCPAGQNLVCITRQGAGSTCEVSCPSPSVCDFAQTGDRAGLCVAQANTTTCLGQQAPAACTTAGQPCQNGQISGTCANTQQGLFCIPTGCTVQSGGCFNGDVCLPVGGAQTGICGAPF